MSRLDDEHAAALERGASELFDQLYDAFGRRLWPMAELNVAAAAFFDMVFKSTMLEEGRARGDVGLEAARAAVLELLARLHAEIKHVRRDELEQARALFDHVRDPRRS